MIDSTKVALSIFTLGMLACSSESTSEERKNVSAGQDAGSDASSGDAGAVDPTGGRDDTASSCFATCQNTGFTCQTKGSAAVTNADLTPDASGCTGTLKKGDEVVAFKLDCAERKICVGGPPGQPPTSCVPGMFSAFSFTYTPAGGAMNECTRD